jgi:hypothetical protein
MIHDVNISIHFAAQRGVSGLVDGGKVVLVNNDQLTAKSDNEYKKRSSSY